MKDQISFFDYSDEFQKLDSHSILKKLSDYIKTFMILKNTITLQLMPALIVQKNIAS
ncbi:hypothetical protein [Natranaerobius trueperi]|uniref:hypothetical protein n=1 Tax=Natranaerobius trueperi TaxID=759412 RepID=UPI00130344F4|nr:hypothetical protein [Natranaerobius trueperi]